MYGWRRKKLIYKKINNNFNNNKMKNKNKFLCGLGVVLFLVLALFLSFAPKISAAPPLGAAPITYFKGVYDEIIVHGLVLGAGVNPDIYISGDVKSGSDNFLHYIKYKYIGAAYQKDQENVYGPNPVLADEDGIAVDSGTGDVYIGGTETSGSGDFMLLKYDNAGVLAVGWPKINLTNGTADDLDSLTFGADEYIYAVGYSYNGTDNDFYIIKYDKAGNIIKPFIYNGGFDDKAYGVAADSSGNVYAVGGSSQVSGNLAMLIVKFPSDGSPEITKIYGGTAANERGLSVAIDSSENSIYVTGYEKNGSKTFTAKYPSNLSDYDWLKEYNVGTENKSHGITLDSLNNVYVSGFSEVGGQKKLLTLKYDSAGNFQWDLADNLGVGSNLYGKYLKVASSGPNGMIYNIGNDNNEDAGDNIYIARYSQGAAGTAPTVSAASYALPAFCANNPTGVNLSWTFADVDGGDTQSAYRLIITRDDAEVYDSQKVPGNSSSVNGLMINGAANKCGPAANPVGNCANFIDYNHSYTWIIKVWDSNDLLNSDDPKNGAGFATQNHKYPEVGFTPPDPADFLVNIPVMFKPVGNPNPLSKPFYNSVCYDANNMPNNCSGWIWTFDGVSEPKINGPVGDTSHVFTTLGMHKILLTVEDFDGHLCSNPLNSKTLGAKPANWKEVIPISE